jgi:hypothetical protein
MVALDITLAVGDGARGMSALRVALVIILALAATSAQAGQAPRRCTTSSVIAATTRCLMLRNLNGETAQ